MWNYWNQPAPETVLVTNSETAQFTLIAVNEITTKNIMCSLFILRQVAYITFYVDESYIPNRERKTVNVAKYLFYL